MDKKRKAFKKRQDTGTGGIRVKEFGLIKVLVGAVVTWGMHNNIVWQDEVGPGYLFNSIDIVGDWHDVLPKFHRSDGCYYRRIGECIPADTELKTRNRGIHVKRLYTKPEDSHWN